jgi:DNA polymerase-3 subunit epsilon
MSGFWQRSGYPRGMRWIGMNEDGSRVTLERFDGEFTVAADARKDDLRRGLVVDVEATGVDIHHDVVIEFAARPFTFDRGTGAVVAVDDIFSSLNDPGKPLTPFVSRLTGLTDADLAGHRLDVEGAAALIDSADIIIAHNARYDRHMVERAVGASHKVWACSWSMVDWAGLGFPAAKLESLAIYHGFFFGAHRAGADVDGLLHLLTFDNPETSAPYLADLLTAARQTSFRVDAVGAPFEVRQALKTRQYRWDSARRVWWREITQAQVEEEQSWLATEIYSGEDESMLTRISPFERFRPL